MLYSDSFINVINEYVVFLTHKENYCNSNIYLDIETPL